MKISELLPCGLHAPGCAVLQAPPNGKVRTIWWGHGESGTVVISNIVEEDDADLPEPLVRDFLNVVGEILSHPTTAQHWHPGSLPRAVARARTVLDLQSGPVGYSKALRAKGRLGAWLQPQ